MSSDGALEQGQVSRDGRLVTHAMAHAIDDFTAGRLDIDAGNRAVLGNGAPGDDRAPVVCARPVSALYYFASLVRS